MARYWFRLFALIAGLMAIVLAIGAMLPRGYQFESRIQIAASAEAIFPLVNTIANWKQWSQWNPDRIENLQVQYSGNESGEGSVQTWTDQRGEGKLWITRSQPNEQIDFRLVFEGFPEMANTIRLEPIAGQTEVIWSSEGTLPSGAFYGYFGPFFSNGMKTQYDQSLQRLKKLAERSR